MDIFEYAKNYNADYYEPNTGKVFLVQNYNKCKKLGISTNGIEVANLDGEIVGYIPEPRNRE